MMRMKMMLAMCAAAMAAPIAAQQEPPQASVYRDRSGSYQSAQAIFCLPAKDGSGCSSGATGPQPAASSQSVTPASDTTAFPVGGIYRSGVPGVSNGQRSELLVTPLGGLVTSLGGNGTVSGNQGNQVTYANDLQGLGRALLTANSHYDPVAGQLVAMRGDTTGTYVVSKGGGSVATGQVTVGTTATLVAAQRSGRQKITLSIGAANTCAFGNNGVTATTGFPLQPVAGATITIDTNAAIYAVCSATTTVSAIELY
jgi:hypothetical protein